MGTTTGGANRDACADRSWTKAEQEAGASGLCYLTQDDPEPQTIYRVAVKSGAPLLVNVGLRYSSQATRPRKK